MLLDITLSYAYVRSGNHGANEVAEARAIPARGPSRKARTCLPPASPHLFLPHWWEPDGSRWTHRSGPRLAEVSPGAWAPAVETDDEIVIQVGDLHADDAAPGDHPEGPTTMASAETVATVTRFEDTDVQSGQTVLFADIGTGHEFALLARESGDDAVTAIADGDTASRVRPRLSELGLDPVLASRPAGMYDRVLSVVPSPRVPPDGLAAPRTGGRLGALLGGPRILIAEKADGGPHVVPVTVHADGTITLRTDIT
ncbi:MAG TPA: hypothetical protein VGG75_36970 [Trebonia sp.]